MSSYHPENPQPVESRWPEALVRFRWFAVGAATAFAVAVAVGTGAAPSPFEPVSEVLGLSDHGESVSDAVEEAKDTLEDGEPVGPAVSEAA